MSKTVGILISLVVVFAAACGDRQELRRDQQQYEVIQEGAGGAVTGTIHGPGETVPPVMPPLTGTSADTTSAFTLPSATSTSTAPPGSIAGTFTTDPSYSTPSRPRSSAPAPSPQPRPQPDPQPVTPAPAPQPIPEPVPTESQPPQDPPPAPQPPPEDEPEPEPQPEPQPPPPPPPPPSSTTDTEGPN